MARKGRVQHPGSVALSGRAEGIIKPASEATAAHTAPEVDGAQVDVEVAELGFTLPVGPLPKVEHREMRFLSPAEIATLAAVIAPRYRTLVLVGGYGGLRIGELAGLRWSRVDLFRARLAVAEKLVEVRGELVAGHRRAVIDRSCHFGMARSWHDSVPGENQGHPKVPLTC